MQIRTILRLALLSASLGVPSIWAQKTTSPVVTVEAPDAGRTKDEFVQLLDKYPPSLRKVLAVDQSLLSNEAYLGPYPALASFLSAHPEIAHNPAFYIDARVEPAHDEQVLNLWHDIAGGLGLFLGFGMALGLIVWLIKTLVDYRRWNRLTKVQTDAHTKLLDRFSSNEDLLAYIQSPAGAKFLESAPISIDAGPRSVAAPLGRILWSIQAGLVVAAAGIGFQIISTHLGEDAAQPLRALGVLGVALGAGFVVSAVISYFLSRRLGLIEPNAGRA